MERDDIIEYSLEAHHSEEEGVQKRKTIWKVTAILTAITIFEVFCGAVVKQTSDYWTFFKWTFICLTLFKASYIVLSFMHLGHEKKSLKYIVLVPYIIFIIYLIFIALTESTAVKAALEKYGV